MAEFLQSVPPNVQKTDVTKGFTGLLIPAYDYVGIAYPIATTEVYTFRSGGASGAVQAIVTVVYTDSTKASLASVTKTPTVN